MWWQKRERESERERDQTIAWTFHDVYRIGPRSEVGQGQCQEKWKAKGGGRTADDEGQGRTMKGNVGRRTEINFYSFLVIPQKV